MSSSDIGLFTVLQGKLSYLSDRQQTLAQNIANADVPKYKAKDIQEPKFDKLVQSNTMSVSLEKTNAMHIDGSMRKAAFKEINRDTTYELNPNGNNVAIEQEMSQASNNQAEYQKALGIYHKTLTLYNIALGKPAN